MLIAETDVRPWEAAPTGHLAEAARATAAAIPRLETPRLLLRATCIGDFDAYAGVYLSDRWVHDEPQDRRDAWLDFCQMVAGSVLRGTGILSIEQREDRRLLGFVILNHEFGDPELELGWILTAEAEGHGYASEAATAFRGHAEAELGVAEVVSYIDHDNARSIVAERPGARRDAAAEAEIDRACYVFRHPAGEGA